MARNCPSYKTMYQNAQRRIKELQNEVNDLEDELYDGKPKPHEDDITIHAKSRELGTSRIVEDPFLDLEGRAILIVRL